MAKKLAPKRLVIVGGGPAGMMAGLLFARAGVETLVLEKHGDFLRDFRGDTVHPSTLELFHELGLLGPLLERPHNRVTELSGMIGGTVLRIANFTRLPVICGFIALMPQWEFLDFVANAAKLYPGFSLRMNAEAVAPLIDDGRIVGVRLANGEEISADLVIAADGRRSIMRDAAALPLEVLGAPMDVLWFRLPKQLSETNDSMGVFDAGGLLVQIDRGDYWQVAYVVPKGGFDAVKMRGIEAFRARIARLQPGLAKAAADLGDWQEVKLLSVALDRLTSWHRPGLLAIGDAAHAMSPIGGVGINLAIQDAVAAANILAGAMARGWDVDALLGRVQARRMLPVRVIQRLQKIVQERIVGSLLRMDEHAPVAVPWAARMLDRHVWLRRIPAYVIGLGIRREHIRSPEARRWSEL